MPNATRNGSPAFLGNAYAAFATGGNPNNENFRVDNLAINNKLTIERLEDQRAILASFDAGRRLVDQTGGIEATDKFTQQAFEIITSECALRACDIGREDASVRDRYGRNKIGQSVLLARRLIEAGVTFVTVQVAGWDMHGKIEKNLKKRAPRYDRGVAALVADIYERGLNQDVLVVSMGEFGRTPKINGNAGRGHWGALMSVLLAGGELNVGQVVGSSNSKGEKPADSPYRPESVLAMVYRHLGIDPLSTVMDLSGRPRHLLEQRDVISELV